MLIDFKLGQGSIVLRVKILNSSVATGAGLTGLTSASSGLIISTIADNEASATAYTVAGSTIESITTLGTFAAPTATKCRFKEVDATNHKGVYELQIADARFAVGSAKSLLISISGATNAAETDCVVPLRSVDPYDAVRGGMTALPNAAANAAGGLPVSTAGALDLDEMNVDIEAIQTSTAGITYTVSNQVDVNVIDWKGAAAPAMTGDAYARLGAPAGASVSADVAAIKAETAEIDAVADQIVFTVTNQLDVNVVDWKGAAAPAMTGDAFARLGAPAGASVSADIAAVKAETAEIDAVTDQIAFTSAGKIDANVLAINGNANAAANLARGTLGNVLCTVGAASTTTSIVTSAMDPAAAAIDQFKGRILTFDRATTTANLRGQSTDITGNTAGGVLTVTALTDAPVSGDTFAIT